MEKHVLNEAAAPAQGQQVDHSEQSLGMAQHARDSAELRRLCAERDEAKRQVAALRQHKTDYMEAAEGTRKALESELAALKAQQVGQEPFGYLADDGGAMVAFFRAEEKDQFDAFCAEAEPLNKVALYTAPQPAPAQDVAGWIPVTERLPEVAQEVIVSTEFEGVCAGVLDSYGDWFAPCSEYKLTRVTHWMPLPAAPAHDKQSGGAE